MKFSFSSFGVLCVVSIYSLIGETLALPVDVAGSSALESRDPSRSPSSVGPTDGYDKFMTWLQSPTGTAVTNICFWSGKTATVSVATKLPELAKKTGCEYTQSLLVRAAIATADSDAFTMVQWAAISRQLAHNARGKAKALLGETIRPDAIFYVDELPILQDSMKKGLVTGIELWKMDTKGKLVGPGVFTPPKKIYSDDSPASAVYDALAQVYQGISNMAS